MKSQIYLCVDLKTITERTCFCPQESRTGVLRMEDEDHFHFYESQPSSERRNPRLWSGKMLNISQKSDGQLSVNFKPMRLEGQTNVDQLIASIYLDLLKAKKDLGL